MRVIQSVVGTFHHFDLAQQLHRRGHLQKIYSTWPWARLKREGLPRELVETFPWLHTPNYVLGRNRFYPRTLSMAVDNLNNDLFDRWISARRGECDALIALSGTAMKTGRQLQAEGGRYICDRGSTHHRYQANIVAEEHVRWGVAPPLAEEKATRREEACYAMADAITVPSSVAKRSFLAMGVPGEKVHVIPYGMMLKTLQDPPRPPADSFEVIFAGHVSLRKGMPYLLEAFAKVSHPRKKLTVVGSVQDSIRALLQRLPSADVEYVGPIPQSQLIERLCASHLLVLPSIEEGLALVQGQALACGCPVLATAETGSEDLLNDGVEGFIVGPRDVKALAEKMQLVADHPALREEMSRAALARVQKLGGWDGYGDAWERLLLSLVAPKSAGRGVDE